MRATAGLLLLLAAPPLAGQAPDSTRGDTLGYRLPALEVSGSLLPRVGSFVGAATPARVAVLRRSARDRRADEEFAGSLLAGDNAVRVGSRLPLVPGHQLKVGAR